MLLLSIYTKSLAKRTDLQAHNAALGACRSALLQQMAPHALVQVVRSLVSLTCMSSHSGSMEERRRGERGRQHMLFREVQHEFLCSIMLMSGLGDNAPLGTDL